MPSSLSLKAYENASYWDWISSGLEIAAVIVASISTDGVAVVAKIAIALASATIFIAKYTNLAEFETMSASF